MSDLSVPCPECNRPAGVRCITLDTHEPSNLVHRARARKAAGPTEARDRAAEAWHQFLASAVSEGAEPHDVFAWAYMAGWAHDRWPAVRDIVPPPDLSTASATERK